MTERPLPGWGRLWLGAVVAILLSACANLPTTRVPDLNALDASGRFVAKVSFSAPIGSEARKDSATGRFVLQRRPGLLQLELASPFGQAMARFTQTDSQSRAWIASPSAREIDGESLESLSTELLGWPVPVQKLATWISLLPSENAPEQLRALGLEVKLTNATQRQSGAGAVSTISDGLWTLVVNDWLASAGAEQPRRPRLISLTNALGSKAEVELRLIIESWD